MGDRKALLPGDHGHGAGAGAGGHGSVDDAGDTPAVREPVRGRLYNAKIDKFFKITERGSDTWTEIRAGLVTFVTMAYILLVNPLVLHQSWCMVCAPAVNPDGHIMCPVNGKNVTYDQCKDEFIPPLVTATGMSAALASILVGVLGNLPFGMAAGMGLNSYFTYGVVIKFTLSPQIALATVFFQGILFTLLALTGLCAWIQMYAPPCIKKSITVGLGLFQALVGLEQMHLVGAGENGVLLGLGDMSKADVWLGVVGIVIITVLMVLEVRASMLVGIVFVAFASWIGGLDPWPKAVVEVPDVSHVFGEVDFSGYFSHAADTIPVTLVFLFVAIFDTAGVQFAAGQQAGLLDKDHRLPAATQAFAAAGVATAAGAWMGTSPVIIHNETCAGIHDGGRTGLTAVVVGCAFILTLPFAPIFLGVPLVASAPPLIVVGALMMACAKFIDWEQFDEAMPAFLVVTILPFTYSIAYGFFFGLGAYVSVKGGVWVMSKVLRREANVMPVTVADEVGVPDPSPGLPATPFVYHSDSYYTKMMSASQAAMGRSQRVVAGGSLTGSNSTHFGKADPEAGAGGGGVGPSLNPLGGGMTAEQLAALPAPERRLALSRSVNQFGRASFSSRSKGALHSASDGRF